MLVRIPADQIREVGRNTQGVRVVRLKDEDKVVGVASAPKDEVEPATEPNGSGDTGTEESNAQPDGPSTDNSGAAAVDAQ